MTFNSDNYKKRFDNLVYDLILDISKEKGIDGSEYTDDCFIEEVREAIIKVADNYKLDLSAPQKEYNIGEKVDLYVPQGDVKQATIVWLESEEKYGLLIDDEYTVIYTTSHQTVDNPTNYVLFLQNMLGINVE